MNTYRDKRTGERKKCYTWIPSDFLRDNRISTDARFLLSLLRTYTNHVNKPAYPTDATLRYITNWGRHRLAKALKEIRQISGTEFHLRKKAGKYCGRNVFLPKGFFPDRDRNSGLR